MGIKLGSVLKGVLGSVAPTIATAVGGPFGGLAADFVLTKLGVSHEGNPEEKLEQVVSTANPDTLLQIKQADNDFKLKLKELGIKETELEIKDRDSARNLAIHTSIKPQVVLSIVYTSGYFLLLILTMSGTITIPTGLNTEFTAAMSFLTSIQLQIMNFWFGSSSGSKQKAIEASSGN